MKQKRKTKETQINNNLFVELTTTTDYRNCSKQTKCELSNSYRWFFYSRYEYNIVCCVAHDYGIQTCVRNRPVRLPYTRTHAQNCINMELTPKRIRCERLCNTIRQAHTRKERKQWNRVRNTEPEENKKRQTHRRPCVLNAERTTPTRLYHPTSVC